MTAGTQQVDEARNVRRKTDALSDSEPDDEEADRDDEEEVDVQKKEQARRPAPAFTHTSFLRSTSSDAWFLSNSHRRNFASLKLGRDILRGTSTKRISQVLGTLDVSTVPHLAHLAAHQTRTRAALPVCTAHSQRAHSLHLQPERIHMLVTQLLNGCQLMLYGVGDRTSIVRAVLEHTAQRHASAGVLIQGAAGRALTSDRIMDAIDRALRISTSAHTLGEDRIVERVQHLCHTLETRTQGPRRLVLGLLAFDHAHFHSTTRMHTLIHALAQCERVHMVASVSHVNAGLVLDSNAGAFSLGISGHAEYTLPRVPGVRTLRAPWLWHHVTTYIPPIAELVQARGTSATASSSAGLAALKLPSAVDLAGGRARAAPGASAAVAVAQPISESAAIQVLQTITSRARSLFSHLASIQLVAHADTTSGDDDAMPPRTPYVALMREALREFIASSDEGVRQLLGEMVDHGLVIVVRGSTTVTNSHAIAVGDELCIPLPVPALEQVLAHIA